MPLLSREDIPFILRSTRTIALVGASVKPWRDSNSIMQYLIDAGYTVVPVNPNYKEVLGVPCVPDLLSIPGPIDMVDIFRNPAEVVSVVEEAIQKKIRIVWFQLGVVNEAAASLAEQAGMSVVMDRCIAVEHRLWKGNQ